MPDLPEDRFSALRGPESERPIVSAAEVRRRGDRRRRTRHVASGVAGVLSVVVLAGGVSALAPGAGRSAPDPVDTPTSVTESPLPTTIPDGAPLDVGLPAENEDGTRVRVTASPGTEPVVACGTSIMGVEDAVDVAGVVYAGGEDYRSRTLVLLDSEAAAQAYVDRIAEDVAACSPRTSDGGANELIEPLEATLGAGSAAFMIRFENAGSPLTGATTYHVVRVLNSVLVTSAGGETANTPAGLAGAADRAAQDAAQVLAALTGSP